MVRHYRVRKNKNTYTISAYLNKVLIWYENDILLESILKYGFTTDQLPQKENEEKIYEVKDSNNEE